MALQLLLWFLVLGVHVAYTARAAIEEPALIVTTSEVKVVFLGERISMSCVAFGIPTPNITWSSLTLGILDLGTSSSGNDAINVYTQTLELSGMGTSDYVLSVLELCSVNHSHDAEYTCTASNSANGTLLGETSVTIGLQIVQEPAFLIAVPESARVLPGERVSLVCAAFGSPTPVITWNSSSLGIVDLGAVVDQSISVYVEADFLSASGYILSVLEFCSFNHSYAADYMCTVANDASGILLGETSAMFTLETIREPAVIVLHSQSAEVLPTTRVSLTCAAYGSPIPFVTWNIGLAEVSSSRDDINILTEYVTDSGGRYFVISILEVCSIATSDSGNYTCTASSDASEDPLGNASATIQLIVEYPAVMTSFRVAAVEAGLSSLNISCTPDTNLTVVVQWTQGFSNGSTVPVVGGGPFCFDPPNSRYILHIVNYDFSDSLFFMCNLLDSMGNVVSDASVGGFIPVQLVSGGVSVWMDSMQLENRTILKAGTQENLMLQCLGAPGSYDLVWQGISSNSEDIIVSSIVNEANLSIVDYGRFVGTTLRCQSQQSNIFVEVFIGMALPDNSQQLALAVGIAVGVSGGLLILCICPLVLCCLSSKCPLRKLYTRQPVPPNVDEDMSFRRLQETVEGEGTVNEGEELGEAGPLPEKDDTLLPL